MSAVNVTTTTAIDSNVVTIPCCLCGTMIVPNAANQCSTCLAQQCQLQELLQTKKNGEPLCVYQCRKCRRYAKTETFYVDAYPESPELLSILLKQIPAMASSKTGAANKSASRQQQQQHQFKLHLVDAMWVWTEPHSRRFKVRVTVRTEILHVPIQQRVLVEFHVHWKQCGDCNREYTSRQWQAILQLRQKRHDGSPRKGLATLEMALAKNKDIRQHVIQMDASRHGLDFYFLTLNQAQQFAAFLTRLAPLKVKTSQKLVSTDNHNNTANIKYTLTADMVPLCRDDLVVVTKEARGYLSGRLTLVVKVSGSGIQFVDASPKRTGQLDVMSLSSESYYKVGAEKCFPMVHSSERLVRFVVLDVELLAEPTAGEKQPQPQPQQQDTTPKIYQGPSLSPNVSKYAMADVLVARESDMGQNDLTYSVVTHLGHLIQPGDIVMGYDLESMGTDGFSTDSSLGVVDLPELLHSHVVLPDVVLVKKVNSVQENQPTETTPITTNTTATNATGGTNDNDNDDDDNEDDTPMQGKKRLSKRKLRRRQKQDKKQRELEETAARMGFLEDGGMAEPESHRAGGGLTRQQQQQGNSNSNHPEFERQLQEDPELAQDLEDVERELATYQQSNPTMDAVVEEEPIVDDYYDNDNDNDEGSSNGNEQDELMAADMVSPETKSGNVSTEME